MSIELYVEPGKTYQWEEFVEQKPSYSIALDGFVADSTKREPNGPYANFDHHSRVDRFSTNSTSAQVQLEINMGLFKSFKEDGLPKANIYVNDCDEDTCLAVWLLNNHEQVKGHAQPSINRLVYCENLLDVTAGAYPFGDTKMRRKMAWIFAPYNELRFHGKLDQLDESGMKNVIEAVNQRISEHVFNGGGELPLEGQYQPIASGKGWLMVEETGPASRMAMYNDGIGAFVALVGKNGSSWRYVLGRKSVWIKDFDIPYLYQRLNEAEGDLITEHNQWGGSNTIGGSPRESGSKLSPKKLARLIEEVFGEKEN